MFDICLYYLDYFWSGSSRVGRNEWTAPWRALEIRRLREGVLRVPAFDIGKAQIVPSQSGGMQCGLTRLLSEDERYMDRAEETSPYPDIGLRIGVRTREDCFPIVWCR